jgi:hypothetical protein
MRPAHVSLEASSVLGRLAVIALLALSLPALSEAQVAQPVDPVSGLAIPLLPGQFFSRTKNGCGVISDLRPDDYSKHRWIGNCRYGVIDGHGFLLLERDNYSREVDAELGYFKPYEFEEWRPEKFGWKIFVPRTTSGPWQAINIYDRTIDNEEKLFNPTVATATVRLVQYQFSAGHDRTEEELWVNKHSCPPDPEWGKPWTERDVRSSFGPENKFNDYTFSVDDISRLTDFCFAALQRLRRERMRSFENVAYGHYHFISVDRTVVTRSPDGQTVLASRRSRTPSLCPDLSTPVGCEPVWQPLLANYVAKYDELKSREAALRAARLTEARRRFAPFAAAWRNRILAITGATPVRSD